MANYCFYEIRAKGGKKAAKLLFNMIPALDDIYIKDEFGTEEDYTVIICGNCKWSLNWNCEERENVEINLDKISEDQIEKGFGSDYWYLTMRQKSELLELEIQARYWSNESDFDQFDLYFSGICVKKRKIAYNTENNFDWNELEFVGHEGEYDGNVNGEDQDNDFMSIFCGSLMQDADATDSAIVGTPYDMFQMTFTEGERIKGDGWSIAIPDGFNRIDSADDRPFELVPGNYVTCTSKVPIRLLPGAVSLPVLKNNWMYHPHAREGIAGVVAKNIASRMVQMLGCDVEVIPVAWDDICGWILLQDTTQSSYSYQITILSGATGQQLRVQTDSITDEQKVSITASVIEWMKTFRFDAANQLLPNILIDQEECFANLCGGDIEAFEKAITQAKTEYLVAVQGFVQVLKLHAEQGLLDDTVQDYVRTFLTNALTVKEFFAKKIDAFMDRLSGTKTNSETLLKINDLLTDFVNNEITELNINSEPVCVGIPDSLKKIYAKWEAAATASIESMN